MQGIADRDAADVVVVGRRRLPLRTRRPAAQVCPSEGLKYPGPRRAFGPHGPRAAAPPMTLLGNLIWLIFGGLISGLAYIVVGLLLCLTIVGAPFGVQAIKIGAATFAPFGKRIVELPGANEPLRFVANIVWLLLVGWELALAHLLWAGVLALTIVGIPFAVQHLKLAPLSLMPFGRDLR